MSEEVQGAEGANESQADQPLLGGSQEPHVFSAGELAVRDMVPASTGKWTAYEIVDGQTVPVAGEQESEPATPAPAPAGVFRLDLARNLAELAKDEAAALIEEGIQAFKEIEGRTMRVVHRLGQLFKQEV